MKKRLIKLISLSLAPLMMLMTVPVHADYSLKTVEYKDSDETDFDNSAKVFAQIESEYKITIPKTIVLSGVSKTANYVVNVDGDIASYETINVVPDDTFALYSLNKNAQLASTTQDKTAWTYSTLGQDALGMVEANDITAGKWQGTFDFNVNMGKVLGDVIDPEFNDLTPDKILAGKTVRIDNLEVVGTATSSATATASNISKDKTAYVNGELVSGTGEDVDEAFNLGKQEVMNNPGNYGLGAVRQVASGATAGWTADKNYTAVLVSGYYGGKTHDGKYYAAYPSVSCTNGKTVTKLSSGGYAYQISGSSYSIGGEGSLWIVYNVEKGDTISASNGFATTPHYKSTNWTIFVIE